MPAPFQINYRPTETTLAGASSVYTYTSSDIPGPGVLAYVFRIKGVALSTGGKFGSGGIERVRLKAGGSTIIDANFEAIRAWVRRFSYAQLDEFGAAAENEAAILPLYFMDGQNDKERFACGFPLGRQVTLELIGSATAPTLSPTLSVGWMLSLRQQPVYFPLYLEQGVNWNASQNNNRYELRQEGVLRAITVPEKGLTRFKVHQNGLDVLQGSMQGSIFEANLLQQIQALESYQAPAGAAAQSQRHVCLRLDTGEPLQIGRSYLEGDTSATWDIGAPDNVATVYTIVRQ